MACVVPRIGVLLPSAANDPETMSRPTAFSQALQALGWTDGRNVRIEFRFGAGNAEKYRKIAEELIAVAPDVVFALGTLTVGRCNARVVRCRSFSFRSATQLAPA